MDCRAAATPLPFQNSIELLYLDIYSSIDAVWSMFYFHSLLVLVNSTKDVSIVP